MRVRELCLHLSRCLQLRARVPKLVNGSALLRGPNRRSSSLVHPSRVALRGFDGLPGQSGCILQHLRRALLTAILLCLILLRLGRAILLLCPRLELREQGIRCRFVPGFGLLLVSRRR